MQRYVTYLGIFFVLVMLQIFLIDNISFSAYCHPLIYIAFIIVLPLDLRPVWVLLLSAALGLTIDMLTGYSGLNVIATTAVGFLRPSIANMACGRSFGFDEALPSLRRFTAKNLVMYVVAMIVTHSVIYFFMESLSVMHIFHTLLRIILSDIISFVIIWYVVKLIIERIVKN